jgi:serine/threonine protein phosphatase PrpC
MEWASVLSLDTYSVHLRVSAASDVGKVRAVNEDSYHAGPAVFLVADGMGGHAHGDRASAEVVRVFAEGHRSESTTTSLNVLESISASNAAVRRLTPAGATESAIAGTTLTGIALLAPESGGGPTWMAFNVGDSRTYVWQAGNLIQVTVDHSAVQELVDKGEITRAQADTHPERNIVTRAMGVDDDPDADVWLIPAGGNQIFVLCSDGLTKELSDDRIAELIQMPSRAGGADSLARRLVDAAVRAGGHDNVTVVVVETEWADTLGEGVATTDSLMPAYLEETAPRS